MDRIKHSISREDWEANLSKTPEEQRAFADRVAKDNVIRVLHDILEQSGTIRRLVEQCKIALVGAMYNVASAEIEFYMDEAIGLGAEAATA